MTKDTQTRKDLRRYLIRAVAGAIRSGACPSYSALRNLYALSHLWVYKAEVDLPDLKYTAYRVNSAFSMIIQPIFGKMKIVETL